MTERYLIFRMKDDRVDELLRGYDYYKVLLESSGHNVTGIYKQFFEELREKYEREK